MQYVYELYGQWWDRQDFHPVTSDEDTASFVYPLHSLGKTSALRIGI
jgi:hypothetical protein